MITKRDAIVFLAGAAALHTISHLALAYSDMLPMRFFSFIWTKEANTVTVVISAAVTIALILWARSLKR